MQFQADKSSAGKESRSPGEGVSELEPWQKLVRADLAKDLAAWKRRKAAAKKRSKVAKS